MSVVSYEDYLRAHFRSLGALIVEVGSYCPVECRHCHVSSDRSTKSNLPIASLEKAIRSFSRLPSASFVSITGGEPFVYKQALRATLKCAKENGLFTFVLTSANWASTESVADRVFEGVADSIDLVGFSVDQYHLERQPIQRTVNALKSAARRSINAFVALGSFGASDPIRAEVRNAVGSECGHEIKFVNYPLLPRGKGAGLPELQGIDLENEPHDGCLSVGTPVVTSTGAITACCHTNVANDARSNLGGPLVLGTVEDCDSAWRTYGASRFVDVVRRHGPIKLAQELRVALPAGSMKWDICRVCDVVRKNCHSSIGVENVGA